MILNIYFKPECLARSSINVFGKNIYTFDKEKKNH